MANSKLADKVKDADAQAAAGTAVEKKTKTIFDQLRDPKLQADLERAVGNNITPERFTRVALTLLRSNPKLAACTPTSLLGSLMICAQLGLEPGGPLGQAYLVPFNNNVGTKSKPKWEAQCTFICGYTGYIALAIRSGQIASVKAVPVFEGDEFRYEFGLTERLEHVPTGADRTDYAKLTHVYAVARFRDKDIEPIFVVLTRAEIDKRRERSRAKDSGPWVTDPIPMAQKSAVRALRPWLPMAVEVAQASAVDERVPDRIHAEVDDYLDVDGEEVTASGAPEVGEPPDPASHERETAAGAGAGAPPGGSPTHDCDACEGSGTITDDEGERACPACEGTGVAAT